MKRKYWLQITSGRGPAECELLVGKVRKHILSEAVAEGINVTLEYAEEGDEKDLFKSILLVIQEEEGTDFSKRWVGSIKWSCQSPFRPKHKRKNWFVGVNQIEYQNFDYKLEDKDIRIEKTSATGPGGQNVNKLELGVRLTHIPTGITAVGADQRSLEQNRKIAMQRLKSKLDFEKAASEQSDSKQKWRNHDALERGNPVRVFSGERFLEK